MEAFRRLLANIPPNGWAGLIGSDGLCPSYAAVLISLLESPTPYFGPTMCLPTELNGPPRNQSRVAV